jgi:hypothetical protein
VCVREGGGGGHALYAIVGTSTRKAEKEREGGGRRAHTRASKMRVLTKDLRRAHRPASTRATHTHTHSQYIYWITRYQQVSCFGGGGQAHRADGGSVQRDEDAVQRVGRVAGRQGRCRARRRRQRRQRRRSGQPAVRRAIGGRKEARSGPRGEGGGRATTAASPQHRRARLDQNDPRTCLAT